MSAPLHSTLQSTLQSTSQSTSQSTLQSTLQPSRFAEVDTPALLLDIGQVQANIALMQARAHAAGLQLRPHAKAHKSPRIARMQKEAGAVGICCAKLAEAEIMVAGGQDDILITTPVVDAGKLARLVHLARQARIAVVADDAAGIHALGNAARQAGVQVGVIAEVDVGQGRCGVAPGPAVLALALAAGAFPGTLGLAGVQGYQGRLQNLASFSERDAAVGLAMDKLQQSLACLRQAGVSVPVVTGGGTGSAPLDMRRKILTELQPGSYISMDRAYAATEWDDEHGLPPFGQPLLVLASVLSRPESNRVVIDVGWKSINSDGAAPLVWQRPDLQFEFAGDEHALLRSVGEINLAPGDRVLLMPGHCDTTVNLYDAFTVQRDGEVEGRWPIEARGKSQ